MTDALNSNGNGHVIEINDLWRIYKVGSQEIKALRGINLTVPKGQFVVLKGRSGSGKTTLLNSLGGLDRPDKGSVVVLGQELAQMNDQAITRWRRERIGLIFQSFGLLPTLSAYENVELILRIKGTPAQQRHDRTMTCLALVGLDKWSHHRPYEMSGGQQQRVAIARALANEAQLILADEPTAELDSATGREILTLFRQIVDRDQITLLMVSHDPAVDEFAHRVLHLKDGQIEETVTV